MKKSDFIKILEAKHDHEALNVFKSLTIVNNELIVKDDTEGDKVYNSGLHRQLFENFKFEQKEIRNDDDCYVIRFTPEQETLENKINDFFDKKLNK